MDTTPTINQDTSSRTSAEFEDVSLERLTRKPDITQPVQVTEWVPTELHVVRRGAQ